MEVSSMEYKVLVTTLTLRKKYWSAFSVTENPCNIFELIIDVSNCFPEPINEFHYEDYIPRANYITVGSVEELDEKLYEFGAGKILLFHPYMDPKKLFATKAIMNVIQSRSYNWSIIQNKKLCLDPLNIISFRRIINLFKNTLFLKKALAPEVLYGPSRLANADIYNICRPYKFKKVRHMSVGKVSNPNTMRSDTVSCGRNNHLVYIDQAFPLHMDFQRVHIKQPNSEIFYSGINYILDKLCSFFSLSDIAFCVHPNGIGKDYSEIEHKRISYSTLPEVINANIVVGFYSEALILAIALGKKVIIIDPSVCNVDAYISRQINLFSERWGLSKITLSHNGEVILVSPTKKSVFMSKLRVFLAKHLTLAVFSKSLEDITVEHKGTVDVQYEGDLSK